NALAIDIMLPAFPNMIATFALASPNDIQFVILTYVSAFGLAQLVFGPVSDRFGRRSPLLFGIVLYIGSAIAGAFAPSFAFLLVARFLQGIGAAATRVVALSVVRDTQAGRAMASTMSLVMMVFMVVPIFAPLTGQALTMIGEWHLIFLFMALLAALVGTWSWLRLPETLPEDRRRPLTIRSITSAFR
ncbi:MAG: MFS transporter, partial [Rhodobacteraceae bacterium]|nr:MFS transporter [Paracoccaceae bacterium]